MRSARRPRTRTPGLSQPLSFPLATPNPSQPAPWSRHMQLASSTCCCVPASPDRGVSDVICLVSHHSWVLPDVSRPHATTRQHPRFLEGASAGILRTVVFELPLPRASFCATDPKVCSSGKRTSDTNTYNRKGLFFMNSSCPLLAGSGVGVLPSPGPQGHLVAQGTLPQMNALHLDGRGHVPLPFTRAARPRPPDAWRRGFGQKTARPPHGLRAPCWRQPRLPDGGGSTEQVERC